MSLLNLLFDRLRYPQNHGTALGQLLQGVFLVSLLVGVHGFGEFFQKDILAIIGRCGDVVSVLLRDFYPALVGLRVDNEVAEFRVLATRGLVLVDNEEQKAFQLFRIVVHFSSLGADGSGIHPKISFGKNSHPQPGALA